MKILPYNLSISPGIKESLPSSLLSAFPYIAPLLSHSYTADKMLDRIRELPWLLLQCWRVFYTATVETNVQEDEHFIGKSWTGLASCTLLFGCQWLIVWPQLKNKMTLYFPCLQDRELLLPDSKDFCKIKYSEFSSVLTSRPKSRQNTQGTETIKISWNLCKYLALFLHQGLFGSFHHLL